MVLTGKTSQGNILTLEGRHPFLLFILLDSLTCPVQLITNINVYHFLSVFPGRHGLRSIISGLPRDGAGAGRETEAPGG